MYDLELSGVNENEFSILFGRNIKIGFIYGSDAVARCNPLSVDEHYALRWRQIGVTKVREIVRDRRSGEKRCA